MRCGIVGSMLIALFVILSVPAHAADLDLDFAPNEERQVTWYGSTSDCVGDPRSPACALDTMIACLVRLDAALCGTVGMEEFCDEPSHMTGVRYKIERVTRDEEESRKSGTETVSIVFREEVCSSSRESCVGKDDFQVTRSAEYIYKTENRWLFRGESDLSTRLCWFTYEFGRR